MTPIAVTKLTDTLVLTEYGPEQTYKGPFWLYDEARRSILAIEAATPIAALTEGLTYYQDRLLKVEKAHDRLLKKVITFLTQLEEEGSE